MKNFIFACILTSVLACSKPVQLDLPKYEPKLTVEFYLEEGRPIKCWLQESLNYTDSRIINPIQDAMVLLKYGNVTDTLKNVFYFDSLYSKVYNYFTPKLFKVEENLEYQLLIVDKAGRELTAKTTYKKPIKIDTIVYDFNQNNEARIGLVFSDPATEVNFYRIVAIPADTIITEDETWSFNIIDNSFNGIKFSFFTGFAFERGREIKARLYNLDKAHYDFHQSTSNARQSNFNPFGQPAPIISNVKGGHGIFTILSYDEVKVKIE